MNMDLELGNGGLDLAATLNRKTSDDNNRSKGCISVRTATHTTVTFVWNHCFSLGGQIEVPVELVCQIIQFQKCFCVSTALLDPETYKTSPAANIITNTLSSTKYIHLSFSIGLSCHMNVVCLHLPKRDIKLVNNATMNITFLCNKLAIQLHATQCTNIYTSTSKSPEALQTPQQKHEHILRTLTLIQDLMHTDTPPLTAIRAARRKIRRFPRIHHHHLFQSAIVMMWIEWTWG